MGNQVSKKELLDIIANVDAEQDVKNRFKEFIKDEEIFRENNQFNHLVVFFFHLLEKQMKFYLFYTKVRVFGYLQVPMLKAIVHY